MAGRDPLKYFRIEVRELLDGLERGLLPLARGGEAAAFGAPLLRLTHTLKGAARVVKQQEIADLAHQFEEALFPHAEQSVPLPAPTLAALAELLRHIAQRVELLGVPAAMVEAGTISAAPDERFETVRIAIADLDALLENLSGLGARVAGLMQKATALDGAATQAGALAAQLTPRRSGAADAAPLQRARIQAEELQTLLTRRRRESRDDLDRLATELRQARERVDTLRLLPAASVFAALETAAREVARDLGKTIDFTVSGGEHRLDAHVLGPLRDALLHLVRNAVDHGIEAPTKRTAVGKRAAGRVALQVERRGQRIVFRCSDDGRGLDTEALRDAAVARGRIAPADAAALDGAALGRLLLESGFSSRREVTQISGRGLGLDIVRSTVEGLKGNLALTTRAGLGTDIELEVPLSLSALDALLVEAGGTVVWLPQAVVRSVVPIQSGTVDAVPTGEQLSHEGRAIPYLPLAELLPTGGEQHGRARLAVVIEVSSRPAAVGIDRLLGSDHIVVRPLPSALGTLPLIEGATLDAEGQPQPVLNPAGLVAAAGQPRRRAPLPPVAAPATILVIDDSLTTRMLEQSILETAGYRVELAVSAEEALAKARQQRYDLFVVDVEMPGQSGFDFVAATRADPQLRETPAILVTSRAAAEDRRRGLEVGARAYVVKGEFDQHEFLAIVRGLVD